MTEPASTKRLHEEDAETNVYNASKKSKSDTHYSEASEMPARVAEGNPGVSATIPTGLRTPDNATHNCYICDRSSSSSSGYVQHLNEETCERSPGVDCPVCHVRFRDQDTCTRHYDIVHNRRDPSPAVETPSGAGRRVCPACGHEVANIKWHLKVQRLSEKAKLPGVPLRSAATMVIPPHSRAVVPTDLSIAVPLGTYGRVAPRSGLAVKKFVDVGAGVIDADYRGPVGIVLFNFGEENLESESLKGALVERPRRVNVNVVCVVAEGDRIAQLLLEQIVIRDVREVESLDETIRGMGGFGSTGV
ncbi:hypothetical protein HK104_008874 [Borealophlyctis nickersoniae]|nr:hypothetical protein HK104_008874 [Borealophlyctis nickersoniae]